MKEVIANKSWESEYADAPYAVKLKFDEPLLDTVYRAIQTLKTNRDFGAIEITLWAKDYLKEDGSVDTETDWRSGSEHLRISLLFEDVPYIIFCAQNKWSPDSGFDTDCIAKQILDEKTVEKMERHEMLRRAQRYLCNPMEKTQGYDLTLGQAVAAIETHQDQNALIDHIDGVVVWEKAEMEFTCDEFLSEIS